MLLEKLGIHRPRTHPLIMGGAGTCKTFDPARIGPLARAVDYLVIGSITVEPREGNTGRQEYFGEDGSGLNAWGMPNPGLAGRQSPATGNLIVSVAGFSVEDYIKLYDELSNWGRGIELNFGCPNAGHRIFSFDTHLMDQVLHYIWVEQRQLGAPRPIIGVKLSPYSDPLALSDAAGLFADYTDTVDYVAVCNTFPDASGELIDGSPAIKTDQMDNFGGASGSTLRPISLGQAKKFRQKLPPEIEVIRVGGIESGLDLRASERAGCAGVQIVTAINMFGPKIVSGIREEYVDILEMEANSGTK